MTKNYASGEPPMVGDLVDLGHGDGPKGRVVVVVGGPNAASVSEQKLSDWERLGPGILVQSEAMGLIYEDSPDDETILIARHA